MEHPLTAERLKKLDELKKLGEKPYRNDFTPNAHAADLEKRHVGKSREELEEVPDRFALAGRITRINRFGKALFADIKDGSGKIQIFLQKKVLGEEGYQRAKLLDVGDIVGVIGPLTRTKTGELTVLTERCDLLVKNLRPMPEKWHGLKDVEIRYRQRYMDLIANTEVGDIFRKRAKAISGIRHFLEERDYIELDTPTMHPIPGGATAKPFVTYHNVLDIDLYLRIATELYLKRLMVGGFERIYEIGRVFRNEGVSTWHNPEFSLLEFYQAYATMNEFIELTEEMFHCLAVDVAGSEKVTFLDKEIDLKPPYKRLDIRQALVERAGLNANEMNDIEALRKHAENYGDVKDMDKGELLFQIYENEVEPNITGPTFVTGFPVEISPLSRSNDEDPSVVDRFELIIAGKEFANAFSELNDPQEQRRRFKEQVAKGGEENPKEVDEDFLRALEVGMPPAAGEGIGIDRLIMLLVGAKSIREVIPFPLLKPEAKTS